MPRKEKTPEERKAWVAKMAALKAEKRQAAAETTEAVNAVYSVPKEPETTTIATSELGEILKRIQELEASNWRNQTTQPPVNIQHGKMLGKVDKFPLTGYPDPTRRIVEDPKLSRFALDDNYILTMIINVSEYETIDHIRMREPKFEIELAGVVFDDVTGEPTITIDPITKEERVKVYTCRRLILHEDPETALFVARQHGFDVSSMEEKAFLDEMRYFRIRDWVMDYFYPQPVIADRGGRSEMVIGGKRVETYEVSNSNASGIPFDRMNRQSKV